MPVDVLAIAPHADTEGTRRAPSRINHASDASNHRRPKLGFVPVDRRASSTHKASTITSE